MELMELMEYGKKKDEKVCVLLGEKNSGKRHTLTKLAINYILDREYKEAKIIIDELQNLK